MGAPFKMKMKSYGKGKNPIKFMGMMGIAMKGMGSILGRRRKRNPRNPQNPQNPNPQNPNPQNPTNAAQGAVGGTANMMPRQ